MINLGKRKHRPANRVQFSRTVTVNKADAVVDICICVYNRFDILKDCLASIPKAIQNSKYNIIIVDNNSVKDDADKFYSDNKEMIIIRNKENVGFPKACNQAARRKQSPFIFMLNSDVILDEHALDYLITKMDDPTVGVCGMKLMFPQDCLDLNSDARPAGKLQHIGLSVDLHGKVHHLFIGWNEDNPKVNSISDVFAVTGAAMLIRRTLWNKIGGFYDGYGMGTYEDVSVCQDIRNLGYRVVVVPNARGIHYVGATAEKYQVAFPLNINNLMFIQRYGNQLEWWDGKLL